MPQIRDNLSKNEITEIITNKIGLSTSYNKKIINDLIDVLIISLNNSKNLKISNFGSFYLKTKKEIIDKKRINTILKRIKTKSIKLKIDPMISINIWKTMIRSFIKYEYKNFKKK